VLAIVLVVLFVAGIYIRDRAIASRRHRMSLVAIRLTVVAITIFMMAQVTLVLKRTGLPCVAVLVDDSLSMTTVDDDKPPTEVQDLAKQSRWARAKSTLIDNDAAFLHAIASRHRLQLYCLTDMQRADAKNLADLIETLQSHRPHGPTTRLGAGVRTVLDDLRGMTPAAMVVLTDGINTDGPSLADAAESAKQRGVPLFTIGFGSARPTPDLKLSDLLVNDTAIVGDAIRFECLLSATGEEGQKITVLLREKDSPTVLAKVEATAGPDGTSQPIRLDYRPAKIGHCTFIVEAEPLPGERQTDNNRLAKTIEVHKDKIRVLLTNATPSFEFRYLRNMLQRDETIALHTVCQEADVDDAAQDPSALRAFPSQQDALFAYDVVILGDVNPALLGETSLQNLAAFVDQPTKGGALILIAGPSYMPRAYRDTPLARLMPFSVAAADEKISTQPFRVHPTAIGLANPAMQLGDTPEESQKIWQDLATLHWRIALPKLKPGVRVLADGVSPTDTSDARRPVFCLQYIGAGQVLFHATDETWRWRYRIGDVYFARYWIQMIHNLGRSKHADADQSVTLTTDRRNYPANESIRLRVDFADDRVAPAEDDGVTVLVEGPHGLSRRIILHRVAMQRGTFEGVLTSETKDMKPLPPGDYRAWLLGPAFKSQPAADFTIISPTGEMANLRMAESVLRHASERTGGKFYASNEAQRLPDQLPAGRPIPLNTLPPVPLWNRWPVLALFLSLIIFEWILRKRIGMS
jgi:hypothetical protein